LEIALEGRGGGGERGGRGREVEGNGGCVGRGAAVTNVKKS